MTNTAAALEAFAPELAARYVRNVEATLARLVAKFGPALRGIANASEYHQWQSIVACCRRTAEGVAINDAQLAHLANQYAADTVAAWAAKIDAKLGELEAAELVRGGGMTFLLKGRKGDRLVDIEQTMIVNISPKGTLFNQFPARIYVDGKFTSAKAFAAL